MLPVADVEPEGHTSQALFPADAVYEPAWHGMQLELAMTEKNPAGHTVHGDARLQLELQYVPATQGLQAPSTAKWPGLHVTSNDARDIKFRGIMLRSNVSKFTRP